MDPNTLPFYTAAGALGASLGLLIMIFAHYQPGTLVTRSYAIAILVLSAGFFIAGRAPELPRWMMVMGANMILISAGVMLHSGFAAFCAQRAATLDRFGWGIAMLTAAPFWYWGLIEPNGNYRVAVFSLAIAAINVRTAILLARAALQRLGGAPIWAMAALFGILAAWMAARGVLAIFAEPPLAGLRGANPTAWITVFWYIVLISVMTVCVMWMEIDRLHAKQNEAPGETGRFLGLIGYFHNRLLLLWVTVIVLVLAAVSEVVVVRAQFYESERARLIQTTTLTNDAFVENTLQAANQVDMALRSVRSFYLHGRSIADTQAFIDSLHFDRSLIENIYLISSEGEILISHDPAAGGRYVADRDYFSVHRSSADDQLFISTVEIGRVTGKFHFRMTRRIDNPDGSFGGIILATVDPESFARYYRALSTGSQSMAALVGMADRKLRARDPGPPSDHWQRPIESPVWNALTKSPSGLYESESPVDGIRRITAYRKVGELPLVMTTGFSLDDLLHSSGERTRWLTLTALAFLAFVFALAVLLTIEIRRRDEQDRFMSMLSHELKTPMSVIRMALGLEAMSDAVKEMATRAVLDMNAVVDRCLQADRLLHGRVKPAPAPCRIEDILDELAGARAAPRRLAVRAENLPACTTDAQLVGVILGNLIDNALKYGAPEGEVSVVAETALHRGRRGIRIGVTNAPGPVGMPDPKRIFRKYYRAEAARGKTGSGLGLHIAAGFARKIGCRLRLQPSAGKVTFELWIPL